MLKLSHNKRLAFNLNPQNHKYVTMHYAVIPGVAFLGATAGHNV